MITNEAELAVAQAQLSRLYAILGEFRRDVLPLNRQNYHLLTEPYVELMCELRTEIDAYFELSPPAVETLIDGDEIPDPSVAGDESHTIRAEGTIRSLDLDARRFVLRNRLGGRPDIVFEYDDRLENAVLEALDRRVVVTAEPELGGTSGSRRAVAVRLESVSPAGNARAASTAGEAA